MLVCVLLIDSSSDILTWCNKYGHGYDNNTKKNIKQIHLFGSVWPVFYIVVEFAA
jgi:hypothetical protein